MPETVLEFGKRILKAEVPSETWEIKVTHDGVEGLVLSEQNKISVGSKIDKKIMLHEIAHVVAKGHHYTQEFSDSYVHLCKKYLTQSEQEEPHGIDAYIRRN